MTGVKVLLARAGGAAHPWRLVLLFALPVLALKLVVAATTFGTNDIIHWVDFTNGVRAAGPVGIYGLHFQLSFYNHPPLIGYFLWFVNGVHDLRIPINFTIRAMSSLADVGTALVLFEMLRRRSTLGQALTAAILVVASPLLFIISGFHGNTDPIFTFLTMLGLYLLVDRRAPVLAGVAIGLAVGIKIVPFVLVPALLIYAYRQGRGAAVRFLAAFVAVVAVTWGPALLLQFDAVRSNVIGYSGIGQSWWGFMQLGHWMGNPSWVAFAAGPGRSLLVLLCVAVPAVAVWRRPESVTVAVAWSLTVFLTLATTFGTQYLVWPLAACYLVSVRLATLYSFSAGLIMVEVYTRWSGGFPWFNASASEFTQPEKLFLLLPWLTLVVLAFQATRTMFSGRTGSAAGPGLRLPPVPMAVVAGDPRWVADRSSQEAVERNQNAAQQD
ncbi:hypothetical protein ABIB25_003714 [Nakamurella sp. UYEF19]|uniref:glycosyltransferase family 39 protein n=1 Tax=Nakamurella sp. UYEF19 TaxID=1756392 RepID=UPI003390D6C7